MVGKARGAQPSQPVVQISERVNRPGFWTPTLLFPLPSGSQHPTLSPQLRGCQPEMEEEGLFLLWVDSVFCVALPNPVLPPFSPSLSPSNLQSLQKKLERLQCLQEGPKHNSSKQKSKPQGSSKAATEHTGALMEAGPDPFFPHYPDQSQGWGGLSRGTVRNEWAIWLSALTLAALP